MARFPGNEFLYDVFQDFLKLCLIDNRSLLWPNKEIWTPKNVAEVKKRMVDSPALGHDLSFEEKLQLQMNNTSSELWGIIADIYYIYFLPSTFIKYESKLRDIGWAAKQGGLVLPSSNASIWEAQKTGFTRTGQRYHLKYAQFWLILLFANYIKGLQDRETILTDYSELQKLLDNIMENIPNRSDRAYDIRHAILYMTYPDLFERIISTSDKENILNAYKKNISGPVPIDIDEAIRKIRKTLSVKYDKSDHPFDFYRDLKKEEWRPKKKMPKGIAIAETETGVVTIPPEDSTVFAKSNIIEHTKIQRIKNMEKETLERDEILLEDQDEENQENNTEKFNRNIITQKTDPEVDSLHKKYTKGILDIQPKFQRHFVWDKTKASRLIESALLDIPLPVVYLSEEKDGKLIVIDGQQRLTSFFAYIDNHWPDDKSDFALTGLNVFKELKGKKFKDIDVSLQEKITSCSISIITFKKESDSDLKFEVFERLNTGSVPLNDQELRNCMYRGKFNDVLFELAEDKDFRYLLALDKPDKRMKDVEFVLRFCSFYLNTYLKYKAPIRKFLNDTMEDNKNISDEKIKEIKIAFKNSVTIIRSLLQKNAFKRFYRGSEKDPNGYWEPKNFNASLYDIMMYSFANADKNTVYQNLDSIREGLINLMTNNQEFIDSIELSTSSVTAVTKRFDIWRLTLQDIIGIGKKEERCFTHKLKEELFNQDSTCTICGNKIASIDDSAVDHVEQYWTGGRTIPENARLTHRYCNWARPRKE